jgi:hypothetical protein
MTQKAIRPETVQNWTIVILLTICIALWVRDWTVAWGLFAACALILVSLFLIIKRTLSKTPKRLGIVTTLAILCWLYVPLLYVLAYLFPAVFIAIYSGDLNGLANAITSFLYVSAVGVVLTTIELFRSSRK